MKCPYCVLRLSRSSRNSTGILYVLILDLDLDDRSLFELNTIVDEMRFILTLSTERFVKIVLMEQLMEKLMDNVRRQY